MDAAFNWLLFRINALCDEQLNRVFDVWAGELPGNWRQELFLELTREDERHKGKLQTEEDILNDPYNH